MQLTATPDKARSLEVADRLVRRAAADGARLPALANRRAAAYRWPDA